MIILDSTLKSLEVLLDGAVTTNQLTWTAHYVTLGSGFPISDVIEADGATNNATAVTLVPAPASGSRQQTKYLSVYNNDTVAQNVTVRINNNGTSRIMVKITLQTGETLEYKSE